MAFGSRRPFGSAVPFGARQVAAAPVDSGPPASPRAAVRLPSGLAAPHAARCVPGGSADPWAAVRVARR